MAKKFLVSILCICILLMVGCKKAEPPQQQEVKEYITIVIAKDSEVEHLVELKEDNIKNGLLSALNYLKIDYDYNQGEFFKVGELEANFLDIDNLKLITIYSNIEENNDLSEYTDSLYYKNQMLVKIAKDPREVVIKSGAIFYFKEVPLA